MVYRSPFLSHCMYLLKYPSDIRDIRNYNSCQHTVLDGKNITGWNGGQSLRPPALSRGACIGKETVWRGPNQQPELPILSYTKLLSVLLQHFEIDVRAAADDYDDVLLGPFLV